MSRKPKSTPSDAPAPVPAEASSPRCPRRGLARFDEHVTEAVAVEVTAWQTRPLEPLYPVVFFDALRVTIREEAVVRSKAIYLALAVLPDGTRDILGIEG